MKKSISALAFALSLLLLFAAVAESALPSIRTESKRRAPVLLGEVYESECTISYKYADNVGVTYVLRAWVDEVYRGEAADEWLEGRYYYGSTINDPTKEEFLVFKINVKFVSIVSLSADAKTDDPLLDFSDFEDDTTPFSGDGSQYDDIAYSSSMRMKSAYEGGSSSGYYCVVVNKSDEYPRINWQDNTLGVDIWFSLAESLSPEDANAIVHTIPDKDVPVTYMDIEYKLLDYDDSARNPDAHTGELVYFKGDIIQVVEDEITPAYRISYNGDSSQIVLVQYNRAPDEARLLDGDTVTVYAIYAGVYTYKTVLGSSMTIPACLATAIVIGE